jgi:hypothetical protein
LQIELGTVASPYTPTTSAAVTTTNDVFVPSGQVLTGLGTASLPSYSALGDTNTGMFFPAADTIAFAEGGAEAMRITSDGRLAVGTTTATSTVDVFGLQTNSSGTSASSPSGTLRLAFSGGQESGNYGSSLVFTQRFFGSSADQIAVGQITGVKILGNGLYGGGLAFWTSNDQNNNLAERLRITHLGQIAASSDGTASAPVLSRSSDLNTGLFFPAADTLAISTGGSERVRVDSSGRVGIGVSSPGAKLHVTGNVEANSVRYAGIFGGNAQDPDYNSLAGSGAVVVQIQAANNNRPPGLLLGGAMGNNESLGIVCFYNSGNTDTKRARAFIAAVQEGSTANEQGAILSFATAADAGTTPTERIRIASDGKLGIGTNAPTALLDVNSDTIRLRTARTPATAGAAGNQGDICWDADYIYICTATNTWKRVAIATWP